ncbi:hypothetical protein ACU6U9_12485 [Pseudomonas sp. HK3]
MNSQSTGAPHNAQAALNPEQYRAQIVALQDALNEQWQGVKQLIEKLLKADSLNEELINEELIGEERLNNQELEQAALINRYPPLSRLVQSFALSKIESCMLLLAFKLETCQQAKDWWHQLTGEHTLSVDFIQHLSSQINKAQPINTSIAPLYLPLGSHHRHWPSFKFKLLETKELNQGKIAIRISAWSRDWLGLCSQPTQALGYWATPLPYQDKSHLSPCLEPLLKYWQELMAQPKASNKVACFELTSTESHNMQALISMAASAYKVPALKLNTAMLMAASATELIDFYHLLSRELRVFQSVCWVDISSIKTPQILEKLLLRLAPCLLENPANILLSCDKRNREKMPFNLKYFSIEPGKLPEPQHKGMPGFTKFGSLNPFESQDKA